jgi:hypothetical protein
MLLIIVSFEDIYKSRRLYTSNNNKLLTNEENNWDSITFRSDLSKSGWTSQELVESAKFQQSG